MSKKKRNPAQFAAAKQFAVEATGYDSTSPIWGKRLPEVLSLIEDKVKQAIADNLSGSFNQSYTTLENDVVPLIEELKKRIAKQAIISNQMK